MGFPAGRTVSWISRNLPVVPSLVGKAAAARLARYRVGLEAGRHRQVVADDCHREAMAAVLQTAQERFAQSESGATSTLSITDSPTYTDGTDLTGIHSRRPTAVTWCLRRCRIDLPYKKYRLGDGAAHEGTILTGGGPVYDTERTRPCGVDPGKRAGGSRVSGAFRWGFN